MKVDRVLRCICADHEPNGGDSVYYGMPQLRVSETSLFEAYCPSCGIGGMFQFKSAYLALKHWNRTQRELRIFRQNPRLFAQRSGTDGGEIGNG